KARLLELVVAGAGERDQLFGDAFRAQIAADARRAELARQPARALRRIARVRQLLFLNQAVEERFQRLGRPGMRRELARELGARMLAPRQQPQRALSELSRACGWRGAQPFFLPPARRRLQPAWRCPPFRGSSLRSRARAGDF